MILNLIRQHSEPELSLPPPIKPRPKKLLDRVREIMRIKHHSSRRFTANNIPKP